MAPLCEPGAATPGNVEPNTAKNARHAATPTDAPEASDTFFARVTAQQTRRQEVHKPNAARNIPISDAMAPQRHGSVYQKPPKICLSGPSEYPFTTKIIQANA